MKISNITIFPFCEMDCTFDSEEDLNYLLQQFEAELMGYSNFNHINEVEVIFK